MHLRHHDNMPTHLQGWWSNAQHTRWGWVETVMMIVMVMVMVMVKTIMMMMMMMMIKKIMMMVSRFEMRDHVDAARGAESFRLCNPPPWLAALNLASLEIFQEAGMEAVLAKQLLLTGFLEALLKARLGHRLRIITPADTRQRGCQLSLVFDCDLNAVHKRIERRGVVCDVRLPSAMRIAPAPLYNSFKDVFTFVIILEEALEFCQE